MSATPLAVIGDVTGDEAYLFQRVSGAALLPDGRVAVADGGLGVVRVFGPDGAFEVEMGRPGDGPGEFRSLGALAAVPPDTLLAWDGSAQRLTVFLADGTLLDTRSLTAGTGRPELFAGRFSDGGVGVAWIAPGPRASDRTVPDPMEVGRYGPDGRFDTLLARTTGLRRFDRGPVPFSPFLHARIHRDTLYHTDGLRPEIRVVDGRGREVRTVPTPRSGTDPAEAWTMLEAELAARDDADALARLETLPRSDSVPHVAALLTDPEGLLWAKRYDPRVDALWLGGRSRPGGGEWWVLDTRGRLLDTVSMPDRFAPLAIGRDRVVGVTRDELGVERVVVHGLRR